MPDLSQKSHDAIDLPARGVFLGLFVSLGVWGLIVVLILAIMK
jgi:hypothetical protein